MRFTGSRLAMKQQYPRLRFRALLRRHRIEQIIKLLARLLMHLLDVDRVGAPDIVLPRNRVVERSRKLTSCLGLGVIRLHKTGCSWMLDRTSFLDLIFDADKMQDGVFEYERRLLNPR